MNERLDAILTLKQAAMDLSQACIEHLSRPPDDIAPLVTLYDHTMLRQPFAPIFSVLLGKLG